MAELRVRNGCGSGRLLVPRPDHERHGRRGWRCSWVERRSWRYRRAIVALGFAQGAAAGGGILWACQQVGVTDVTGIMPVTCVVCGMQRM